LVTVVVSAICGLLGAPGVASATSGAPAPEEIGPLGLIPETGTESTLISLAVDATCPEGTVYSQFSVWGPGLPPESFLARGGDTRDQVNGFRVARGISLANLKVFYPGVFEQDGTTSYRFTYDCWDEAAASTTAQYVARVDVTNAVPVEGVATQSSYVLRSAQGPIPPPPQFAQEGVAYPSSPSVPADFDPDAPEEPFPEDQEPVAPDTGALQENAAPSASGEAVAGTGSPPPTSVAGAVPTPAQSLTDDAASAASSSGDGVRNVALIGVAALVVLVGALVLLTDRMRRRTRDGDSEWLAETDELASADPHSASPGPGSEGEGDRHPAPSAGA
jgi:hypothetical protein